MKRMILIAVGVAALCGGCITNNYNCTCDDCCKGSQVKPVESGDPIVSPDKIDNTKQEDGAPQYPNVKPWYTK